MITFDTHKYNFAALVSNALGVEKLEDLHLLHNYSFRDKQSEDQNTYLHKILYDKCGSGSQFSYKYHKLIQDDISKYFDGKIIYQNIPTFRIHLPNNVAVAEYHKDRDYGHFKEEINFYLPITNAFDTNTIWIETEEDAGDYYPIEANYGEIVSFDGANLNHGNCINDTNKTRISIDFRVMEYKYYKERGIKSVNGIRKLIIGDYYCLL